MQGIMMLEELLGQTVAGNKTMTRRSGGLNELNEDTNSGTVPIKPRYAKGEVLYLKEPFQDTPSGTIYKYMEKNPVGHGWKNKMFMPQNKARYFIKITNVRVERLHSISDEDCLAEGIERDMENYRDYLPQKRKFASYKTPRESFFSLFNKANGEKVNKPVPNIWVFVYSYEFLKDYKNAEL